MSKHFSTVLGILFLFVFTFTLVVTTASEVKAVGSVLPGNWVVCN